MRVVFSNGGSYDYSEVPIELWRNFEATFQTDDSSGKFFRQRIRNVFKVKKIEIEKVGG